MSHYRIYIEVEKHFEDEHDSTEDVTFEVTDFGHSFAAETSEEVQIAATQIHEFARSLME